MSRHHRATLTSTYCGLMNADVRSTRFGLLSTCPRCHAVRRFFEAVGLNPLDWQHDVVVARVLGWRQA